MDDTVDIDVRQAGSGSGSQVRLFVAMSLPQGHAQALLDHAALLASTLTDGHVEPDSLHLTWAFLGDVCEDVVPAVIEAVEVAALDIPGATACSIAGVDMFAEGRELGFDVDVELLAMLDAARDRFLDRVAPCAPHLDRRPWRPHVAVLRSAGGVRFSQAAVRSMPAPASATWIASELRLYVSLPASQGHRHRMLHAVPFGASVHGT